MLDGLSRLPLYFDSIYFQKPYALAIFLPMGLRVLATWLYNSARAIIPLALGGFLSLLVFGHSMMGLAIEQIILGSCSAYLTFELFRICGFNLYADQTFVRPGEGTELRLPHWRNLLLVGLFTALSNALMTTVIFHAVLDNQRLIWFLTTYLIGDVLGLILVMVALLGVVRITSLKHS